MTKLEKLLEEKRIVANSPDFTDDEQKNTLFAIDKKIALEEKKMAKVQTSVKDDDTFEKDEFYMVHSRQEIGLVWQQAQEADKNGDNQKAEKLVAKKTSMQNENMIANDSIKQKAHLEKLMNSPKFSIEEKKEFVATINEIDALQKTMKIKTPPETKKEEKPEIPAPVAVAPKEEKPQETPKTTSSSSTGVEQCKTIIADFNAAKRAKEADQVRQKMVKEADTPKAVEEVKKLSDSQILATTKPKVRIDVLSKEKINSIVKQNLNHWFEKFKSRIDAQKIKENKEMIDRFLEDTSDLMYKYIGEEVQKRANFFFKEKQ